LGVVEGAGSGEQVVGFGGAGSAGAHLPQDSLRKMRRMFVDAASSSVPSASTTSAPEPSMVAASARVVKSSGTSCAPRPTRCTPPASSGPTRAGSHSSASQIAYLIAPSAPAGPARHVWRKYLHPGGTGRLVGPGPPNPPVGKLPGDGIGVSTSVGIGGDSVNGSSFRDRLGLFEHDDETDAVPMTGDPAADAAEGGA
jgi:hypothetical protein